MFSGNEQSVPTHRATIVVVDDEEGMCRILGKILGGEGYHVTTFWQPAEAIAHIRQSPPMWW